VEKRVQITV